MARRRLGIFKRGRGRADDAPAGAQPGAEEPTAGEPVDRQAAESLPGGEAGRRQPEPTTDTVEWTHAADADATTPPRAQDDASAKDDATESPATPPSQPEQAGPRTWVSPPPQPSPGGDIAARIRGAAETAAHEAEQRAMGEILALEGDLERARREAAGQLEVVEGRLAEAERRTSEAQRVAEQAEQRAEAAEARIEELQQAAAPRTRRRPRRPHRPTRSSWTRSAPPPRTRPEPPPANGFAGSSTRPAGRRSEARRRRSRRREPS